MKSSGAKPEGSDAVILGRYRNISRHVTISFTIIFLFSLLVIPSPLAVYHQKSLALVSELPFLLTDLAKFQDYNNIYNTVTFS